MEPWLSVVVTVRAVRSSLGAVMSSPRSGDIIRVQPQYLVRGSYSTRGLGCCYELCPAVCRGFIEQRGAASGQTGDWLKPDCTLCVRPAVETRPVSRPHSPAHPACCQRRVLTVKRDGFAATLLVSASAVRTAVHQVHSGGF